MKQPIQKIAVPIDFSPFSKAVVSYAAVLAKFFNAAMVLINVIDRRGMDRFRRFSGSAVAFNGERFEKERTADRMRRLKSIATEIEQQGLQIETYVLVDVPFRGILKCVAQSKSDVLVMATKGRTNTADVLVGSCAEKLFRHSPVPVLSIPAAFVTTHERRLGENLSPDRTIQFSDSAKPIIAPKILFTSCLEYGAEALIRSMRTFQPTFKTPGPKIHR